MADTSVRGGRTFFGHPWGPATLFSTEVWERFGFYGLRGMLGARRAFVRSLRRLMGEDAAAGGGRAGGGTAGKGGP